MDKRLQPARDLTKACGYLAKAAEGAALSLRACTERMHDTMHDFHMRQMMQRLANER